MGKKGNWFSALKRAFTSSSKDKLVNEPDKIYPKEKKKWGFTRTRHGEANSFMPLYREPSSIEKILGDAEREQNRNIHQRPLRDAEMDQRQWTHQMAQREIQRNQQQKLQQLPPRDIEREHHHHQKFQQLTSREVVRESNQSLLQPPPKKVPQYKTPKSKYVFAPKTAQISAIKIQAAYRGYLARKSFRALKGLMRLQSVMKGQSVKRQTMNTMRCMQMLVRVQSQIRTRRLQMMESRNIQQHQMMVKNERDIESNLNKWNFGHQLEAEGHEGWEDSTLTKDEIDVRMRRKVEAVIKRERALAYAYSHQLLKVTPMSAQAVLSDIKSGGFPWWWSWLERQVGTTQTPTSRPTTGQATTPKISTRSLAEAYPRPSSRSKQAVTGNANIDASTPRSSKPVKQKYTPNSSNRWQVQGFKDDDSLTSCPAFSVPNYMVPTVSAKAKVRDGPPATPEGKRRFSFGLTQSIGSIRWSKGSSVLSTKDSESKRMSGRHRPMHSIGNLSMDSTISLPVGVGGRSFR
ncbi:IQ motif EF-hand binding site domain-containing protein [Dioscorea alata]|uniref:IQ motif EF-hand binding site domain-containing protein n=2 Tax=Dioscorea alata TaxID=55571 RepID=A0ACB7UT28_DIOAL|nr:IQ motif EF-hand binding site domain-containing protein [Dioscorea alata]KAH7663880.1 IQ motif EF-hand binding site domain-containing protein [Dioscorea alata]